MSKLRKETIRFYKADTDLIRKFYPGSYGNPGINEVMREIIHSWVEQTLVPIDSKVTGVPDVKPAFTDKS